MSNKSSDDYLVILLFSALIFFGLVWSLSSYLGSDFGITITAVILSIAIIGITIFLIVKMDLEILPYSMVAASLIWPTWWSVIHSIATGGKNQDVDIIFDQPWWDTGWTRGGIEVLLIGAAVWLFLRNRNHY